MWLYMHHTCSDIIDLDSSTLTWRKVQEEEKPAHAKRLSDLPVRGSYTIENGHYYFSYWADDNTFHFSDDQGFDLIICKKLSDGSISCPDPSLRCTIESLTDSDGLPLPEFKRVRLSNDQNNTLFTVDYNALFYQRLMGSDFTAASMVQTLPDWDFFAALEAAFPLFQARSRSGAVLLTVGEGGTVKLNGKTHLFENLLFEDSGSACPQSGRWFCVEDTRQHTDIQAGQIMPEHQGCPVSWACVRRA